MNQFAYKNSTIAYEIVGEGTPIVFFHGWGIDHHIWSGCMEPIFTKVKGYKRVYLDLPGMGESKAGEEIHSSDEMLEILYAFLSKYLASEKFVLMGQSYGGYLARGFVHEHQDMVMALGLVCPLVLPGYRTGRHEPLVVKKQDCDFLATLSEEERQDFMGINVILTQRVWESYRKNIIPGVVKRDQHFLDCVLEGACSFDVDKVEKTFDRPVLIVVGKGDTEVGYKDQFDLLSHYVNSSYHVVNDAGHNLAIEQPKIFEAIVSSWLEEGIEQPER